MEEDNRTYVCYTLMVNANNHPNSDLLILGGSSSLGQEIIIQAKKLGISITATSRSIENAQIDDVNWKQLNIDSIASIDIFLNEIADFQFSTIIFCIGSLSNIKFNSISLEQTYKYLETYVFNATYLITKLTSNLNSQLFSKLVYVSSRAALYPSFDFYYAMSKAAISSFVSSLSRQLPIKHSTYVFVPGLIKGSNMYNKMDLINREDHENRANHKLVTLQEAANFILKFDYSTTPSGYIVEVGPSYK